MHVYKTTHCDQFYGPISNMLTFIQSGLYWFHLSAGIPAQTTAHCIINGLNNTVGIIKSNTAYLNDQVTTDGLSWVARGQSLSVVTSNDLFSSSTGETAWLWFKLDTIMQTLVAFYVVKTSATSLLTEGIYMAYDKVIVNEGNGWNENSNKFFAPASGYYFISFSISTTSGERSYLKLVSDSTPDVIQMNCIYENSAHNGVEIARSAVMIHLNVNDTLASVVGVSFSYAGSQLSSYVYLQGFLYNPSNSPKLAWSVMRKVGSFTGPIDSLQYDTVYVNEGNPWNTTTNHVCVPIAGLYFIDLTTYMCESSNDYNENIQVSLNNSLVIELKLNTD